MSTKNFPDFTPFETTLMKKLIENASQFKGFTRPNPVVAAAIYKNETILGIGVHQKAGDDHAEVIALSHVLPQDVKGASIMVTLEPCTHHGKTPPCVDAIIQAGMIEVIFASLDPNPLVRKQSAQSVLEQAGIAVRFGLCESEAEQLNLPYYYYHRHKRPYVMLKAATSLDGKIALSSGESKYITSEESLKKVHEIRAQVDAILIGQQTAFLDDASLSVRFNKLPSYLNPPAKIMLCQSLKLEQSHCFFDSAQQAKTIIASQDKPMSLQQHTDWWPLATQHQIDWDAILDRCYEHEFHSILIEGGSHVFSSAIEAGIVNQLYLFMAPKLMGEKNAKSVFEFSSMSSLDDVFKIKNSTVTMCGEDVMIMGFL